MIIACFDPGNHTGWVLKNTITGELIGGTFLEANMYKPLVSLFEEFPIDLVVYETFNLYPGMSKHLAWNSFYPVEIIGILKFICWNRGIQIVGQAPSIKKFAGTLNPQDIKDIKASERGYTEHTKDALLHYMYYARNNAI